MTLMTARMAAAMQDDSPRGFFVAIDHPDGTGYFHSGVGSIDWNGHMWAGVGTFGKITPIKHTSDIAVQDITFSISGVDTAIVEGLSDDVLNRNGSVWLYCLNYDGTIIPDPYKLIDSSLDYQTFKVDSDGTCTVEITAHAGFYTLARAIEEAWTPENQKSVYPDDTGMDMIPTLVNSNLQWTPV
jgi:hypothetical protein